MKPQLKNYKKFFTTYAEITCLHTEFLLNGALKKNDLFATYKDGVYNIFLNREKENICFNESLELFKDDISYKKHFNEFKYYLDSAIKTVVQKYKIIPKNISKEELKQDLIFIGQFWKLYGTTESPYLDKAYEYMKQTRDEIMKQNLYNWA
ncbi:MAG: hypothetical protein KKF89_04385 [Nanoarchaeota archaeon]|nr:hypothetical protein [Nanoarchaeota archaeon]